MEASSSSNAGGGANIHLGQTSDIATAFLTALDTSLSKKWREEDRMWRQQDISYRKEEREYRILEQLYREQQVRIELEESVLHVHVGSPDFLGELSVLRVG